MTPARDTMLRRPSVRTRFVAVAVAFVALVACAAAHAEYPDHPIRLVVGFGPGSGSDIQGRVIAEALGEALHGSVFIDNRPGAAGAVAAHFVANAKPDGYTLVFGTTTLIVTLPLLNPHAGYDGADFVPIGTMGKSPFVVVVPNRPGAPATLEDLLAAVKRSPRTFGSVGVGSFSHLASARLLKLAGVDAVHVPYKASPQELQDVVSGELTFATDSTVATRAMIQSGLLKPLAVTSRSRVAGLPDVPTVAERFGKDFEVTVWTGLLAPKGTPPAIVAKLSAALQAALRTAPVRQRFADLQLEPFDLDAPAFAAYLHSEQGGWQTFIRDSGIRLDE